MTRSCFLSAGGDVFIASLVLKLWQDNWRDEIDHMWICFNNHSDVPKEVVSEFLAKWSQDPKVRIIFSPQGLGNGKPITLMTKCSDDDLVILLEDDGFIYESGAVNKCFQDIESDLTDIVGSPRFSCGTEIGEASKIKYSLDYSGYGDVGPNFWPNFFFCKREDLLKTDLNFASIGFKAGDYCKELDYTFKDVNYGDTFVWACMQLRALGLRSQSVPQHHAGPFEIQDKEKHEQNWHPTQSWFPWIHGGSLSTSWNGYLSDRLPDLSNESAIQETETRVAFWTIASDVIDGFTDFKKLYEEGIENLIVKGNLDRGRIAKKIEIYRNLMKL